jgi:hypothetical protein
MGKTEERLLKEKIMKKCVDWWFSDDCKMDNNRETLRNGFVDIAIKETKKAVYEDVKKMIDDVSFTFVGGEMYINRPELLEKLGEEKLTSQKDGERN